MYPIFNLIFGLSPQMILSVSADQVILRSKIRSKFIVFLMLTLLQVVLLPMFMPVEYVIGLLFVPLVGGLTYSKTCLFDRETSTLTILRKMFWIELKREINFTEIDRITSVTNPLRVGTYVFLYFKSNRRLLLDLTTNQEYIDRVIAAVNRVRNLTMPLHSANGSCHRR